MAVFRYKGRTGRGDAVDGVLEAESAELIANRLFASGITPIEIVPSAPEAAALGDLWRALGGGRPKLIDLILFSRQMYTITKAGVPLLRGMRSLAASTPNAVLREALYGVVDGLQAGRDLAASLARFPDVFSKFYVSIVRVGESSGTLPLAFQRMFEHLTMEKAITDKLKSALRYPLLVMAAIVVAVGVITTWVLPKFAPIFRSLGDGIPWPTRALLASADFVSAYWYLLATLLLAAYVGVSLFLRSERGRYQWDRAKLRLPVFGAIVHKATLARVCRSFAVALEAGVPMGQALGIVSRAAGNEYMTERLLGLRNGVERGASLSLAAQTGGLFTPLVLQMIAVGEETGDIAAMLLEVADAYERDVDYALDHLSAALEPLLIVAVGGIVLVLALGVFLPLWDMAANAGGVG